MDNQIADKADAEATIRSVVTGVLSQHGGEPLTAENGYEIAAKITKAIQRPDVIWATKILNQNTENDGN